MKLGRAVIAGSLLLAGCVPRWQYMMRPITPQDEARSVETLRAGEAVLDCQRACARLWLSLRPELQRRYLAQDWRALATLVMLSRYQQDLAYFYLGRAAEGLHAYNAALNYYRLAGVLMNAPSRAARCENSGGCDGLTFPGDLRRRTQFVQDELARGAHARAAASRAKPAAVDHDTTAATPAAAPPPAEEPWITPAPAAE